MDTRATVILGEPKIQISLPKRLEETERFKIPDGHLRLTERFFSIEGEGILIGAPCYLIRFAGCNLRCTFCDTKFSSWWDYDYTVTPWKTVLRELISFPGWVSYTGGEPLWRHENELHALADLIIAVDQLGRPQKVETSGTVDPPDWFPYEKLFFSIAPKIPGMGKGTFCDTDLLTHILNKRTSPERCHIKFVIGSREERNTVSEDLIAVKDILNAVPHIILNNYTVIFTPEGLVESTAEYIQRMKDLLAAIQSDPFIFSLPNWRLLPQLHQILWRNERGR